MKKPFILITGDDSVRAEGIVLVKRIVEKFADYQIVATNVQQSTVGTAFTTRRELNWGFENVDGHRAIWVDGTPSDSVLFALSYLKNKPDLVVSGVNYGKNLADQNIRSGTLSAALTASVDGNGIPAISFAIQVDPSKWNHEHDGSLSAEMLEYPGKLVEKIIRMGIKHIPLGVVWQVNFPSRETKGIRPVQNSMNNYYKNRIEVFESTARFKTSIDSVNHLSNTDVDLLMRGYTTLVPYRVRLTDHEELSRLKKLKFEG